MKLFHKTNLTVLLKSDLHLVRRRIRANEEEDTYMCLVQVLDRSEEAMRALSFASPGKTNCYFIFTL